MKNLILTILMTVAVIGVSFAAVDVQQDGTRKNRAEKINFKNGPTVTANASVTDVDFDNIVIAPVAHSSNPCATIGSGTIFFNSSTNVPCYCNGSSDYAIYSASTRCF